MMLEHAIYLQRVVTSKQWLVQWRHIQNLLWWCLGLKIQKNAAQTQSVSGFCSFLAIDSLQIFWQKQQKCWMISTCHRKRNGIFVSCSIHTSSKVTCCSKKCVNCEHDLCSEIGPTVTNLLKLVFHLPTFALMHLRFVMSRSFWQNWGSLRYVWFLSWRDLDRGKVGGWIFYEKSIPGYLYFWGVVLKHT